MFQKNFIFTNKHDHPIEDTSVSACDLYSPNLGYGFVIEKNRNLQENLQISELNAGFEPQYWLNGEELSKLFDTSHGVALFEGNALPLIFKTNVPKQGNYHITVNITAGDEEIHDLLIFTGRRRLLARKKLILPNESFVVESTINICDIIPRGKTECYEDTTCDLTILADHPVLTELKIEETECPTIYIAGDSTVADQSAAYPYLPGCSYCGWAQMFPYYVKSGLAVSNHAHSGETTESFRKEGHYDIILKYIKPGDYFFLQFAHNDQKLTHLAADGGYADRIRTYVNEIREKGAIPVIVTPFARNTWKGDGTYNDLLIDYALVCKVIGEELRVPVLDLHGKSKNYIIENGLERSARYYFPKDYTHSNDFGGFLMSIFVAEECLKTSLFNNYIQNVPPVIVDSSPYSETIQNTEDDYWIPPLENILPTPPAEFTSSAMNSFPVNFNDIHDSSSKSSIITLTELGVISNADEKFRPTDIITRIESLDWIIKCVRFVPTNVYNDRFQDVIGHEWYAGIVETAFQNDIVPAALTTNGYLKPLEEVTAEQFVTFCMNSYKCRKIIKGLVPTAKIPEVSPWAKAEIDTALFLKFISNNFQPKQKLTREEAAVYIKVLINWL